MTFELQILVNLVALCTAASKYYDGESRPYKFAFKIENNQHRQESKDENGVIMGEFGFLTADGVYRITTYATDENGNFKVVARKNIPAAESKLIKISLDRFIRLIIIFTRFQFLN